MSRLVLDAGAYVAFEKGDEVVRAHLKAARELGLEVVSTAPVVAQVWRSHRQVRLVRLRAAIRIDAPGEPVARRAGELLAKTRTRDVVDALVVLLARDRDTIITSDPTDLELLLDAAHVSAALVRA